MKVEFSWKFYTILLAIVLVSFAATWLLPIAEMFKGFSAIPGIGALLMAIYQIWRDRVNYERQKELQREQLSFNLSVTSHMANVAFDKHVEFCEKYIAQMNKGLRGLWAKGPTTEALAFASQLSDIRSEFRAWLTEDIMTKILPFEKALRDIGAKARIEQHLPVGEKLTKVVDEMFEIFSNVTGIADKESNMDNQIAHEKIITHLQQVLGIQELTQLRQKVIAEAMGSSSRKTL